MTSKPFETVAFAAGTTDGPGAFDFIEGTNSTSTNPYWNYLGQHILGGILGKQPSLQTVECQFPKPILLPTQDLTFPCPWSASVVPLQLLKWGEMIIIGVPGEFTTMSGRRLRNTVRQAFADAGVDSSKLTISIAGLAGAYTHYVATFEEYSIQRYAGASTLFGPHTLEAYQQEFYNLAFALAKGQEDQVPAGPPPSVCDGPSRKRAAPPEGSAEEAKRDKVNILH